MFLNILEIVLAIVLTVAVFIGIIYFLVRVLKNDASTTGIILFLKKIVAIIDNIDKTSIPFTQRSILNAISVGARLGAEFAEQLYLKGEITAESRFEEALSFTKDYVQLEGIDISDKTETVIKKAIEASVFELPKTH